MILLSHKQARFDYTVGDTYQAGLVLSGAEVKSLRNQSGSLKGSFVKILGGEAFLLNAQISPYKFARQEDYDPKRTRKLLLRRKEITKLQILSEQKGITLVPLSIELIGQKIKLKIGVGRGKKQFEKRSELKKRVLKREIEREFKEKLH